MAVLKDVSKPSYEDLLAMVAKLQAEKVGSGTVSFSQSEKNPKFFTFKHGVKDAWPVSTTPAAWRAILANVDMIKSKLPK